MNKLNHIVATFVSVATIFAVTSCCSQKGDDVEVSDLRCRNLENPEGVDRASFSWEIETDLPNVAQNAWEIEIASTKKALEKGKADNVVEWVRQNGKTFVRINDYNRLRELFGSLLAEIQRIKSEGDFEAARLLVENYAVKVDSDLHAEVLERYRSLHLAPYKGFVNPVYTPQVDGNGEIVDVTVSYDEGYVEQMLRYSRDYSNLLNFRELKLQSMS